GADQIAQLTQQLEDRTAEVTALTEQLNASAGGADQIAQLNAQIADLEAQLAAQPEGGEQAQALQDKLTALQAAIDDLVATSAQISDLNAQLSELPAIEQGVEDPVRDELTSEKKALEKSRKAMIEALPTLF
ncbi:MAG: hypothetical protein RSC06_11800, partial [Clostridia bacterium]